MIENYHIRLYVYRVSEGCVFRDALATILLISASSRIDAEFFVSIDTTLIGDEEVLGEIVQIIKRELNDIDDITVIESPEQAEITLRFHIAQIVTETGL